MNATDNAHPSGLEVTAELVEATGGGLRIVEVGLVIFLGLLVCPPFLILAVVVAVPVIAVSALVAAVVAGYAPGDIAAIGITASPCGGCRQWLHEFGFDRVSFRRADGTVAELTTAELLPESWDLPE
jgi:hypothetical protein